MSRTKFSWLAAAALALLYSSASATVLYQTGCNVSVAASHVFSCTGDGPDPDAASHDETRTFTGGFFGANPDTLVSRASAADGLLQAFVSYGDGNGSSNSGAQTTARYTDTIYIDWAGGSSVTLALNVDMAGAFSVSGSFAFASMYLQSRLGSSYFTTGSSGVFDRYSPLHTSPGSRCNGSFCDELTGNPEPFDVTAQLKFVTVPTNTLLGFSFELIADVLVGASGGLTGTAHADLWARPSLLGDVFTVSTSGFDGNIHSESGLIANNRWVIAASVPEPGTLGLLASALVLGAAVRRSTRAGAGRWRTLVRSRPARM